MEQAYKVTLLLIKYGEILLGALAGGIFNLL